MASRRKNYKDGSLKQAVQWVLSGEPASAVSRETAIPYSTLRKLVAAAQAGVLRVPQARGPPPLLPQEAEIHLSEWVVGRQQVGYPVGRREIIRQARAMSERLYGRGVGDGWYRRFMQRHPSLAPRTSQSLSKARNIVDTNDVHTLFSTLLKLIIEERIGAARIFNVDETAFETRTATKPVIVVRGSKNVWHTDVTADFHLTIVACGSAEGFVVPPLFVLPGKTVWLNILEGCDVPGAAVTTTESGFMNHGLFQRWLAFFAAAIPTPVRRPLVLIMDGCASHISPLIIEAADAVQVKLVCLPANATHLFQPLVDKASAIKLASLAWEGCNFGSNMAAGFCACGLFPLSLPCMHESVENFSRNGTPRDIKRADWLKIKDTVREDVLTLPPPRTKRKRQRKTATVAGQLLTHELLAGLATSQPTRKKKVTAPPHQQSFGAEMAGSSSSMEAVV